MNEPVVLMSTHYLMRGLLGFKLILCNRLLWRYKPRCRQQTDQQHGKCSSNKKVGKEQLCILGVQDAPVFARTWILELYRWHQWRNVGAHTQGLPSMGPGNKQGALLFSVLCTRLDAQLYQRCQDAERCMGKIWRIASTTIRKLHLRQELNNVRQKDICQWPTTFWRSKTSATHWAPFTWRWRKMKWYRFVWVV